MVEDLAKLLGGCAGCLACDRRRRLGALLLPGRPDRQGREADRLHRGGHLRRHPAPGRDEGLEEHHRDQQGRGGADLLGRRPRHRGRRAQGAAQRSSRPCRTAERSTSTTVCCGAGTVAVFVHDGEPGCPRWMRCDAPDLEELGRQPARSGRGGARPPPNTSCARSCSSGRDRRRTVKAVGAGHSFSDVGLSDGYDPVPGGLRTSAVVRQATLGWSRSRQGRSCTSCRRTSGAVGLAFENLGDIDCQTMAGASATATHGTGARFGGLSAAIVGHAHRHGAPVRCSSATRRPNPELLRVASVGVGALGMVSTLTLRVVPAFHLHAIEEPRAVDEVDGVLRRAPRRERPFRVLLCSAHEVGAHQAEPPEPRTRGAPRATRSGSGARS